MRNANIGNKQYTPVSSEVSKGFSRVGLKTLPATELFNDMKLFPIALLRATKFKAPRYKFSATSTTTT
jgi:hypothetical protein